ncbi:MAG: ATP-dependent zinc metalloprotease FtsH [Elusimicrobia bacterium]|nr:ATP-dependent zinc metalloprotease FtsH [Elusimicrobiota bacterium]
MGVSRFKLFVFAAVMALSSFAQAAAPQLAELLRKGDKDASARVTAFALQNRGSRPIHMALERYQIDKLGDAGIKKGLAPWLMKEPEHWATLFSSFQARQEQLAAEKKKTAGDAYKRNGDLAAGLDVSKNAEGRLDKIFDNSLPKDDDADSVAPAGWGSKPPQSGGSSGGRITFDDVVGIDEQKGQLMEIVDMLKHPERYRRAGADIPTGILMAGPPGTGKTYTAQALANEAGVNFLSMEGPAFINKYVGESAAKVREFFAEARSKAPCIVFIDEIEALAGKRVESTQGADKETNGAVTQLLVEMDGMTDNLDGTKPLVIVVGATNRIDMLDPAVLRPGRFDRKVIFNLPDVKGREAVLNLYVNKRKKKGVPYAEDLDLKAIAVETTGMSPADLRNVVNMASTLAARENRERNEDPSKIKIGQAHLKRAIEQVQFGTERKMVMTEKDKKQTAFHELGHAVVGTYVEGGDPITKITIIPRDTGAGGVTMSQPAEDRAYWTKTQFLARIAMAMGGRVAEKTFFGEITTGPSSDLEHASDLARSMIMQYGMSDELGPVTFVQNEQGNYLNRGGKLQAVSEATQQKIDAEVKRILLEQEQVATGIVSAHKKTMESMVPDLLEKETLQGAEFRALLTKYEGKNPPGGGNGGGAGFNSARRMSVR